MTINDRETSGPRAAEAAAFSRSERAAMSARFLAHDLNNVLQIIGGNLDLLDRALSDNHEGRRHLRSAIQGVSLGTSLASTALFSPDAKCIQSRALSQNLSDFGDLIAAAAGPDILLRLDIGSALPPVRGDVNDLKNVVLNLVINARDAMQGLGELDVSFVNCPTGENVVVTVRDNGPGIAPEFVRRVFDPTFSTKSSERQRGLGLASVQMFAEETGTNIVVNTGPHGTAIALRIPALVVTVDGTKQ